MVNNTNNNPDIDILNGGVPYEDNLMAVISSWEIPSFRKYMTDQFRLYWIKPISKFCVSYDWLSAKGFFKDSKNFKPFASFLPLIYRLMEIPEYNEKSPDLAKWDEIAHGIVLAVKTGKKYIKVFSSPSKLQSLLDEVAESLFAPYGLTSNQKTAIWGEIAYDTQNKPLDFHPFLMPHKVYESFIRQLVTRHLNLHQAFKGLAESLEKANVPPTYNNL